MKINYSETEDGQRDEERVRGEDGKLRLFAITDVKESKKAAV